MPEQKIENGKLKVSHESGRVDFYTVKDLEQRRDFQREQIQQLNDGLFETEVFIGEIKDETA